MDHEIKPIIIHVWYVYYSVTAFSTIDKIFNYGRNKYLKNGLRNKLLNNGKPEPIFIIVAKLQKRVKMNQQKGKKDICCLTLLRLFHLDDPGTNKLLNLVHNHWVSHVFLCCARILLKIAQYLFGEEKAFR